MAKGEQEGEDQHEADHEAATAEERAHVPHSFCFQRRSSPECPKAKRVFPATSNRRESPRGSSNVTTRDETELGP